MNDPFELHKKWILPEEKKCYSFDVWEVIGQQDLGNWEDLR